MMNRIEVACQVTFDDPATTRVGRTLQLYLHGAYGVMHASFWPETIGEAMKIAFPYWFHDHQHAPLNNTVSECWNTQRPGLAVAFWNVNSPDRLRPVRTGQQSPAQVSQMLIETHQQSFLVHSINARCHGAR